MRASTCVTVALACAVAACVPADESPELGSVQFTFVASEATLDGVRGETTADGWAIRFDRVVLGFKTMTIGRIGVDDACAYRGRGEAADVVFDPRRGLVQAFNGLKQTYCPDVGIIFGPPDAATTLGNGAVSRDLVDLAAGVPAHAIIEATATETHGFFDPTFDPANPRKRRILLRLDHIRTSSRFGGCRSENDVTPSGRGVEIRAGARTTQTVRFGAEVLFREAIGDQAALRLEPFLRANTNVDDVVTMAELDGLRLSQLGDIGNYRFPNGSTTGTFGDFVRVQFRFAFQFGTEGAGVCLGNEPGADDPTPSP